MKKIFIIFVTFTMIMSCKKDDTRCFYCKYMYGKEAPVQHCGWTVQDALDYQKANSIPGDLYYTMSCAWENYYNGK